MTGWHVEQAPDRSARAMIAVTLLALVLVAAVPVALLAAVIVMILGHVVAGLAVTLAGMSGMRQLRKLISRSSFPVVRLDGSQYTDVAEPEDSSYDNPVQLERSEYTEVR